MDDESLLQRLFSQGIAFVLRLARHLHKQLKWVWGKFGQNRKVKKWIIIDEARLTMDTPETIACLENVFQRARKHNTRICAATQDFSLDTLAIQQQVSPAADFDRLIGDFWPDDESADHFIEAMQKWRTEGRAV